MVGGGAAAADESSRSSSLLHRLRARSPGDMARHGGRRQIRRSTLTPATHGLAVLLRRQIVRLDRRRVARIGRLDAHEAAAFRPQQRAHAGTRPGTDAARRRCCRAENSAIEHCMSGVADAGCARTKQPAEIAVTARSPRRVNSSSAGRPRSVALQLRTASLSVIGWLQRSIMRPAVMVAEPLADAGQHPRPPQCRASAAAPPARRPKAAAAAAS